MTSDPLSRVRAIARKLPGVEEGTTFGFPAFKVGGGAFAWFPSKKEVEPGSLGVRMSILEREHRIAAPMVGGMVSSTVLTLVVIPAVYSLWKEQRIAAPVVRPQPQARIGYLSPRRRGVS